MTQKAMFYEGNGHVLQGKRACFRMKMGMFYLLKGSFAVSDRINNAIWIR